MFVVIRGPAGDRVEPAKRAVLTPVYAQGRTENIAIPGERSVPRGLLEENLEIIAKLQVVVEIDLSAEDVRQGQRQVDLLASLVDGGNQRGAPGSDLPVHSCDG